LFLNSNLQFTIGRIESGPPKSPSQINLRT
jgi:hypothetical protein